MDTLRKAGFEVQDLTSNELAKVYPWAPLHPTLSGSAPCPVRRSAAETRRPIAPTARSGQSTLLHCCSRVSAVGPFRSLTTCGRRRLCAVLYGVVRY
jgi:hypothetical protein